MRSNLEVVTEVRTYHPTNGLFCSSSLARRLLQILFQIFRNFGEWWKTLRITLQ